MAAFHVEDRHLQGLGSLKAVLAIGYLQFPILPLTDQNGILRKLVVFLDGGDQLDDPRPNGTIAFLEYKPAVIGGGLDLVGLPDLAFDGLGQVLQCLDFGVHVVRLLDQALMAQLRHKGVNPFYDGYGRNHGAVTGVVVVVGTTTKLAWLTMGLFVCFLLVAVRLHWVYLLVLA